MAFHRTQNGRYGARFYDSNRSPELKEMSLETSLKFVAGPKLRLSEEVFELGIYARWNGA